MYNIDMEKLKKENPELYHEVTLASYWNMKFKEAMVTKAEYIKKWQMYWDAYRGDYFKDMKKPEYKSDLVSNYIFSIIETIRPIMLDNDPKFQAMPRQPEAIELANDVQEALAYEWDRESMRTKLFRELITMLVTGTSIFFQPWDSGEKQIKGIQVNPFNLFPDPLATCVKDAEYIIYATYQNAEILRRKFPNKANRLTGANVNYGELVHNNHENARVDNQILVLEVYTRDYETRAENGEVKYPKGRVITVCPEIGVVLGDKANPYNDGEFPFTLVKDYDVPGKFWGEGEVAQLLSPQKYMNELNNAILDNAKATANMPWLVDKNSGIGQGKITSRPGLILRKNPGTTVERMQAPNMPNYVINAVEAYKQDMEQVSGVFDTLKGNSETGVYTAQGILALQEAGQARIRLKVKLLEESLGAMATKWVSRMRQFWTDDRYIRITKADGTYKVKEFKAEAFNFDYDVKITAGSTMPVNRGAMLDLMVRLAQTQMPDGQNIVDREAVVQYLPEEVRGSLLKRMQTQNSMVQQQIEEIGGQLEQFITQDQQDDQQTMSALEGITQAIEDLNKKILQLSEKHATIEKEREEEVKTKKIKDESFNEGYKFAESSLKSDVESSQPTSNGSLAESEPITEDLGQSANPIQDELAMDEELLNGLDELSDDELALLMQQNPELGEMLPE